MTTVRFSPLNLERTLTRELSLDNNESAIQLLDKGG